jgi:Tryptophan-associated transmembrane protein (Trp_oprn_chp)
MSRRSLAFGFLLAGSLLASAVAWTDIGAGEDLFRALALAALAGTVLIVVLRVNGRRVVGLLLGLLGVAMALAGVVLSGPTTPWRVAYSIGGVLVLGGGLLTLITAAGWPAPARRFERTQAQASTGTDNSAELWQALDAGLDPTADPDVRKPDPGDTMRNANQSQQSSRRK